MMAAGGLRKKTSKVNAFKTKLQISHCCFVYFNKYYENTLSLSVISTFLTPTAAP